MFSEVDVQMNKMLVAETGNMYPSIAYFHTLLRSSQEMKESTLTEQLYFADCPGLMDTTNVADGNYGLFQRPGLTKGSNTFEVAGPMLGDCPMFDRYLFNGVKLDICLKRSSPTFCLMSSEDQPLASDNYSVVTEGAFLRLYKLKINPSVLVAHSKLLHSDVTAKYPYTKRDVKYCTVPPNLSSFSWSHICQNLTPSTVVVAFCLSEAVAGSYKKNPWHFINCDVKQLPLCVNGISTPGDPIHVDYSMDNKGGKVLQVFDGYLDTLNNINVGIARAYVGRGYAIYVFYMEPSFSENTKFPPVKSYELYLIVRFGTPLQESARCVIYTEKVGLLEFDKTRNIKIN
ncbi:uncharacterized protein LOC128554719 [Mercenaria mercenaria]|uniref:uncharacterized protein LOC128554719 n=1 Tax=Mercenaria mercenaria TaxID=6596 RepID=UPI00234E4CA8|nr:uncharacterized protein LOC128554719 [Mercenaria mercenaria]